MDHGGHDALVGFLKDRTPDFVSSDTYLLHKGKIDDLPGVVLAAFGRYVCRLIRNDEDATIPLSVLEEVAEWADPVTDTALRDELFESIDNDVVAEAAFRKRIGGRLHRLYEDWKASDLPQL